MFCHCVPAQFYEDNCLLEQKYVMDELRRVGQVRRYRQPMRHAW